MDVREQLARPAAGRLREVVGAALGAPDVTLGAWNATPLGGGAGMFAVARQLYLLGGVACVRGTDCPWSLVLKIAAPAPGQDDPTAIGYWRREALLYPSGLLNDLPPGLRAPRCYGCDVQVDGQIWLWLEHVREDNKVHLWPVARWALAARHLGQFNGAYLAGRPLPRAPWLGGGRLRSWLASSTLR